MREGIEAGGIKASREEEIEDRTWGLDALLP
jgi:hypothetical protein